MRIVLTIGAAALVLTAIVSDAEARGRRGGRVGVGVGVGVGTSWTSTARSDASAKSLQSAEMRLLRGDPSMNLRPVAPVVAPPAPVVQDAAAARPWCASGRIVGSGMGFCAIN